MQQCHAGTSHTHRPQIIGHFVGNYYWPCPRRNLAISSMMRKTWNFVYAPTQIPTLCSELEPEYVIIQTED